MTELNANNPEWPISQELFEIIQEAIRDQAGSCVVTFRDPKYSANAGGFHPVEIMVGRGGDIQYVTDFSFVGRPPAEELVKELDFDFTNGVFRYWGGELPILAARPMFHTWEKNFVAYHRMGAYTTAVEEI